MKTLLFGATGMVGTGVLLECLADDRVTAVTAIGRSPSGRTHPKLTDLPHQDFLHYESLQPKLTGYDACFFCLGVSSLGLDEAAYTRITYDYTLAAARACPGCQSRRHLLLHLRSRNRLDRTGPLDVGQSQRPYRKRSSRPRLPPGLHAPPRLHPAGQRRAVEDRMVSGLLYRPDASVSGDSCAVSGACDDDVCGGASDDPAWA